MLGDGGANAAGALLGTALAARPGPPAGGARSPAWCADPGQRAGQLHLVIEPRPSCASSTRLGRRTTVRPAISPGAAAGRRRWSPAAPPTDRCRHRGVAGGGLRPVVRVLHDRRRPCLGASTRPPTWCRTWCSRSWPGCAGARRWSPCSPRSRAAATSGGLDDRLGGADLDVLALLGRRCSAGRSRCRWRRAGRRPARPLPGASRGRDRDAAVFAPQVPLYGIAVVSPARCRRSAVSWPPRRRRCCPAWW